MEISHVNSSSTLWDTPWIKASDVYLDYRVVQARMRQEGFSLTRECEPVYLDNEYEGYSNKELWVRARNGQFIMAYSKMLNDMWSSCCVSLLAHHPFGRPFSSRREGACKRIQRAWRRARYDPAYMLCKRWCHKIQTRDFS